MPSFNFVHIPFYLRLISTREESFNSHKELLQPHFFFLLLLLLDNPSSSSPYSRKKMAKVAGIFVCLLIVALDILAGILGIEAEMAQNKVKHLRAWIFECREPSHDAFKLGLAAAALLGVAHVIANLLGGCMCICSQEELQKASPNRQLTVACFVFTWIILAVGLGMLVIGTLANNKSRASCGFTHHHFLSIGGILCFVHGLFCVAYYVSANAALGEEGKYGAP